MMSYLLSLVAGIVLFIISLFILKQSLHFIEHSEQATGTVIELENVSGDGGTSYAPVFNIKTNEGGEIIYRHTAATYPSSWSVGEKATFLYDPNEAHTARLLTYFGLFSWTIVLMALAVILVTIGSGYYLLRGYVR